MLTMVIGAADGFTAGTGWMLLGAVLLVSAFLLGKRVRV